MVIAHVSRCLTYSCLVSVYFTLASHIVSNTHLKNYLRSRLLGLILSKTLLSLNISLQSRNLSRLMEMDDRGEALAEKNRTIRKTIEIEHVIH